MGDQFAWPRTLCYARAMFKGIRKKLAESAVEAALNAFWIAVYGVLVTAAGVVWMAFRNLDSKWLFAFAGALASFTIVVLVTWALVWIRRRRNVAEPQKGRKGMLNYIIDRDRSIAAMSVSIDAINKEITRLGNELTVLNSKVVAIQLRGGPRAQELIYAHTETASRRITKRVAVLEIHTTRLRDDVNLLSISMSGWLDWAARKNIEIEGKEQFLKTLATLKSTMTSAAASATTAKGNLANMRELSDDLDRVGERLMAVLDVYLDSMKQTIQVCDDSIRRLAV